MFRLPNVLSVKLSSGLSNIFLIPTTGDNYIYKAWSFAIEIRFQNKWLVLILKFKQFTFYDTIATKATFSAFCWFEEHKSLFKLDGCLLQSINLCLANILTKVFEIWRFPYISALLSETRLDY